MELDLPKDVVESLPEPDSQGVVRCTVGLRVGPDGTVELVEVNDVPVGSGAESDQGGDQGDTGEGETPMKSPSDVEKSFY